MNYITDCKYNCNNVCFEKFKHHYKNIMASIKLPTAETKST